MAVGEFQAITKWSPAMLLGGVVALFACARALAAMWTREPSDAGGRALAFFAPIAAVSLVAMLLGRPEIAVAGGFGASGGGGATGVGVGAVSGQIQGGAAGKCGGGGVRDERGGGDDGDRVRGVVGADPGGAGAVAAGLAVPAGGGATRLCHGVQGVVRLARCAGDADGGDAAAELVEGS